MSASLVEVAGLSVSYRQGRSWRRVVEDVSFHVSRGEVFGLVGESGCGKSTVALQLLGYRHATLRTDAGRIVIGGLDVRSLDRDGLDRMRGAKVSFVPQNPTTALNPGMRVNAQIDEVLLAHDRTAGPRAAELFDLVGLPTGTEFLRRYPHQLSGGQQQRVCIAMALACEPELVVLDEPTTGLDVTTQEQIADLLIGLRKRLGMSMLYVTHDLGLLSQIADRIGVMYAGRMVEVAAAADLFAEPRHPYTRGLIGALPRIDGGDTPAKPLRGLLQRDLLPKGCPFAPRCGHALEKCFEDAQVLRPIGAGRAVACWRFESIGKTAAEPLTHTSARRPARQELLRTGRLSVTYGRGARAFMALKNVSLDISRGETVALVGESGSGKSTMARAISGLIAPASGEIYMHGERLAPLVKQRSAVQRRLIQYVFQNPDASLNPRATVGTSLARPSAFFFPERAVNEESGLRAALDDVRLDESYAMRYPDQLSGGERQRVAIARALTAEPDLLLCDEVLSALDVSVQASILELLQRLKAGRGVAMLFISHDLAVVRMLADRVHVLFRGEVMESGTRDQIFVPPFHPYTHALLEAVPVPLKTRRPAKRQSQTPHLATPACPYAERCSWRIGPICAEIAPPLRESANGHAIRCHHDIAELLRLTSANSTGG